ncbi:hypothetical protein AAC387_Pa09g1774 [Persea americana]
MQGVKDRYKIVLIEDPINWVRRYLEIRENAKVERASKSKSEVRLEVDKLATQVSALESVISKGGKVLENDVLNLIELLMMWLIKLDGVIAKGDVKLQRKMLDLMDSHVLNEYDGEDSVVITAVNLRSGILRACNFRSTISFIVDGEDSVVITAVNLRSGILRACNFRSTISFIVLKPKVAGTLVRFAAQAEGGG